jgi:hypothetical protein
VVSRVSIIANDAVLHTKAFIHSCDACWVKVMVGGNDGRTVSCGQVPFCRQSTSSGRASGQNLRQSRCESASPANECMHVRKSSLRVFSPLPVLGEVEFGDVGAGGGEVEVGAGHVEGHALRRARVRAVLRRRTAHQLQLTNRRRLVGSKGAKPVMMGPNQWWGCGCVCVWGGYDRMVTLAEKLRRSLRVRRSTSSSMDHSRGYSGAAAARPCTHGRGQEPMNTCLGLTESSCVKGVTCRVALVGRGQCGAAGGGGGGRGGGGKLEGLHERAEAGQIAQAPACRRQTLRL